MAEPQYFFAEIPLSRNAFDRWLKSTPCPASHWPEWGDADIADDDGAETVLDALMPFFIAEPELQQCLLIHDKQQAVLRCALWLRYEEMRAVMMRLLALLRGAARFMSGKAQGQVQHGENWCGTMVLTCNETRWEPECSHLSFPEWSAAWLLCCGEETDTKQWVDAKIFNALKRRYNHYLLHATPERPIGIKKMEYYSDGHQVVDYYGNCIKGANPLTFRRLCRTYFDTLYTDGKAVWIDSDILDLHRYKIADNLTAERIQVLDEGYDADFLVRIDDKIWFRAQDQSPGPFYLTSLPVDPDTFHRRTAREYADKNAIYRNRGNRVWVIADNIHPKDVIRVVDNFLITKSEVLSGGKALALADSHSFRSLGHDFYCDDNHVWLNDSLLEKLNPQTFRFIVPEFKLVADDGHVYFGVERIPDADAQTLEVLSRGLFLFWRDRHGIWYQNNKCEGADPTSGEIEIFPGSVFFRLGKRVWGMATELKDVDVESFVVTSWDYAKDKHGLFYRNRRLEAKVD